MTAVIELAVDILADRTAALERAGYSRRQRVVLLTQSGYTATQIAQIEQIARRSVVRIRSAAGCSQAAPRVSMTAAELRAAEELLDDGCSYVEVGRTLGFSESCIRRHFPGRGWPVGEGARFALQVRWANHRAARVGIRL